jgi:tryptophan 2,3-dioxygenase
MTDIETRLLVIADIISEPALYEQLAEECSELAQAALKKARKLRNENYTPKTMDEIDADILEEYNDVRLCAMVLNLSENLQAITNKLNRWIRRNTGAIE